MDGDSDGDGDIDQIFALGSRSIFIWTGEAELAFDSGDDFEQIIVEAIPECFNLERAVDRFVNVLRI